MDDSSKITAEWVVRAQLTICRPNSNNQKQEQEEDRQSVIEQNFNQETPIKVAYKWCSNDDAAVTTKQSSNLSSKDSSSFRSTGVTSSDSGIGTARANVTNHTDTSKSLSTCNIILTACTNVIPESKEMAENLATSYYTLFSNNEVFI